MYKLILENGTAVHFKDADGLENVETADILAAYNKLTGRNTIKFSSREKGIGQFLRALEAAELKEISLAPDQEEIEEEIEEEAKVGRPRVNRDAVIRLKAEKNPKRPGSSAYRRFALYKDGMTIGEFLKVGGTIADIRWDKGRGFIEVQAPQQSGS